MSSVMNWMLAWPLQIPFDAAEERLIRPSPSVGKTRLAAMKGLFVGKIRGADDSHCGWIEVDTICRHSVLSRAKTGQGLLHADALTRPTFP